MTLQTGAVKAAALKHNLQITQPDKIKNNADLRATLEAIQPDAIFGGRVRTHYP